MARPFIVEMFRSGYCRLVFLAALPLGYWLTPRTAFHGWYALLGAAFVLSFALVMACTVRHIKERARLAATYSGLTIWTVAAAAGLAGLQACGIGVPMCGAALGAGFLSLALPLWASHFIMEHAVAVVLISLAAQTLALLRMNCFTAAGSKFLSGGVSG